MTTLSNEQLREALKKDFHSLYVKGFTTSWEAERLVRDTEIEVMSLDNLTKLFASQRQAITKDSQVDYNTAHKEGESCAWASITSMFIDEFDDPEDIPQDTNELAQWIKNYRQAILKEVREGLVRLIEEPDEDNIMGTVMAVPLAHLDALEKKYKGGE